ncbi:hypothetical protein IAU60_003459 [Kwoniella sp. DSM 27419]
MLRDPASRPASPFNMSPHPQLGLHAQHAYPSTHVTAPARPAFTTNLSAPGPSTYAQTSAPGIAQDHFGTSYGPLRASSSQPTPIPAFQPHSHSVPSTPSYPPSRPTLSPSHAQSYSPVQSQSMTSRRPKPLKKPSASTSNKQRNVQMSLEVKVEKARGFHAFFVPLCKNLPPAPPSSPVLHAHGKKETQASGNAAGMDLQSEDYFGSWKGGSTKIKERDQWVEDVRGDAMELDAI